MYWRCIRHRQSRWGSWSVLLPGQTCPVAAKKPKNCIQKVYTATVETQEACGRRFRPLSRRIHLWPWHLFAHLHKRHYTIRRRGGVPVHSQQEGSTLARLQVQGSYAAPEIHPLTFPGSLWVCILDKQIHWWRNLLFSPLSPRPLGHKRLLCENVVSAKHKSPSFNSSLGQQNTPSSIMLSRGPPPLPR